ncbi:aminotransferase class I/II-fold pyridoxal phosphate-dependent enzyme [Paenibacillus rhizoplanae]
MRRLTETVNYPLFTEDMNFNSEGLLDALLSQKDRGKAIVLLNFPNNPTGYTPGIKEGEAIVAAILRAAEEGINVVVVSDDAYFGLFFSRIQSRNRCSASWRICTRACWRSRLTEPPRKNSSGASASASSPMLRRTRSCWQPWSKKTLGIIRATISSGAHPSQTFVLDALKAPEFAAQKEEKFQIMKGRANKVKALLDSGKYGDDVWTYYPFNSGYFMCLKLLTVPAEELRLHLIHTYGLGTIALGESDLRIAFSCIEEDQLEDLFDLVYAGIRDLEKA